jgi:hypothetical protein
MICEVTNVRVLRLTAESLTSMPENVLALCGRSFINGMKIQVSCEESQVPDRATNASIASMLLHDRA